MKSGAVGEPGSYDRELAYALYEIYDAHCRSESLWDDCDRYGETVHGSRQHHISQLHAPRLT